MRHCGCVGVLVGLLATSCYRSPAAIVKNTTPNAVRPVAAQPVERRYTESHTIGVVCDQPPPGEYMCPETADDTLVVRPRPNGSLAVEIELVQTNGHTCSFEGTLVRAPATDPDTQRWTFSGTDEDFPCELELVQDSDEMSVSSTGCRDYCGVRATLDATFSLDTRAIQSG